MNPRIQTRSGKRIDLLNPDPSALDLGDIAYALAHLNRYTGHAGPYTVAQHSVLVCRALRAEGHGLDVQRAGLMHDAHEAIVGDVSSPVKRAMRRLRESGTHRDTFGELEGLWSAAFAIRFGFEVYPEPVRTMDLRMLRAEARDLMGGEVEPWGVDVEPWPKSVHPWPVEPARNMFLDECRRLGVA